MITYEQIQAANKTLKSTDVKGNPYVEVNERIKAFRMVYPEGFIITETISNENGVCVMQTKVGFYDDHGNPFVIGTGTAYEKEGSTYINKTSYIENCVPLTTQILTKRGWRYYYQIHNGDEVLSFNMNTGAVEYCKVTAINIYKDAPIVELKSSRFMARCTPQHKWVTAHCCSDPGVYAIEKRATEDLRPSDMILQNSEQSVQPSVVGRKLGWLLCDCEIARSVHGLPGTAYISQAKYVEDVEELFGMGVPVKMNNKAWKQCYNWNIPAETVREVLGHFDIATYEDFPAAMAAADIEDVAGCFQSMMLADGEKRGFSSTYKSLIDGMVIACTRLGKPTGIIKSRMCKGATKPIYTLPIKSSKYTCSSELVRRNLPPTDVWCPTTENGTWFMKQGDFVTMTSNCETSAVGRALGMAGFGIDTNVASAEEVQNAIINQEKASPEQIARIKELIPDINALLKFYKINNLKELTAERAQEIIKRKEAKNNE